MDPGPESIGKFEFPTKFENDLIAQLEMHFADSNIWMKIEHGLMAGSLSICLDHFEIKVRKTDEIIISFNTHHNKIVAEDISIKPESLLIILIAFIEALGRHQ